MAVGFTTQDNFVPSTEPKLHPSSASRWFHCSGSAWMAALFRSPSSDAAKEGTAAHVVFENTWNGVPTPARVEVERDSDETWPVDSAMVEHALKSVGSLKMDLELMGLTKTETEQYEVYKHDKISINMRVDLSAIGPNMLATVDYKYGQGRVVPVGNPQLGIYLCALRQKHGSRGQYMAGILQPRGRWGSHSVQWWALTDEDLDGFEAGLTEAIYRILWMPIAYNSGSWCRWCPGSVECPTKAALYVQSLLKMGSWQGVDTSVNAAWILDHADEIKQYIKDVEEAAVRTLEKGMFVQGWTLEEKLSKRTWKKDALDKLDAIGTDNSVYSHRVMRGIGEVEKHFDVSEYVDQKTTKVLKRAEDTEGM